jgi:hypothetical protein
MMSLRACCRVQGHLDAGRAVVTAMWDPALSQTAYDHIMPVVGASECVCLLFFFSPVSVLHSLPFLCVSFFTVSVYLDLLRDRCFMHTHFESLDALAQGMKRRTGSH